MNFDGSLSGYQIEPIPPFLPGTEASGEWIELYNPDLCEPIDISCYYLGNSEPDPSSNSDPSSNYGGGFQIPAGTIVPPAGFCIVRGENSSSVPANLKVENGGNVVEVTVPKSITGDGVCVASGGHRLWFPNAGGWFAFYDANGVPQDAISWGNEQGANGAPCVPIHSTCNTGVTSLASYNNIPSNRKEKIYGTVNPSNSTIRRMPDGGAWAVNQMAVSTMGECNDVCAQVGSSTCDGTATINVTGGSGNYTYVWDDSEAQITQTANGLCDGTYQVVVTDIDNNITETFTVEIENIEISFTSSSTPSNCGNSDGSITVTGADGAAPYSYSVDNGTTSQGSGQFNGLVAGSYDIVVNDDNGCTATGTEIVGDVGEVEIESINSVDPSCFEKCDGVVNVLVTTGVPPYAYQWTDSNGDPIGSTSTVPDLCAGTYTVLVTDDDGCTTTGSITLTDPAEEDASFELTDYCEGATNAASNIAEEGGVFSIVSPTDDGQQ